MPTFQCLFKFGVGNDRAFNLVASAAPFSGDKNNGGGLGEVSMVGGGDQVGVGCQYTQPSSSEGKASFTSRCSGCRKARAPRICEA